MKHSDAIEKVMKLAIKKAQETMNQNIGGPFGAAVIDANGEILSVASNSVLKDHDATAHAEINAIRQASQTLGTYDLSGCTLVTTAYPCPMCLGAIIWSNIKHVVYGCRPSDAAEIGFRDDAIYKYIEGKEDPGFLDINEQLREECLMIFKDYHEKQKTIY